MTDPTNLRLTAFARRRLIESAMRELIHDAEQVLALGRTPAFDRESVCDALRAVLARTRPGKELSLGQTRSLSTDILRAVRL